MILALLLALGVMAISGCGEDAFVAATGTIYGQLMYTDHVPASDVMVLVEELQMTAVTDARGEFVMNGVLAVDYEGMGKYYNIRGYGERDGEPVAFYIDQFKVKGQQSYSLGTVVVQDTGRIIGAIYLDDATTDHSGVRVSIEGTSMEAITRADGIFVFTEMPAFAGYNLICEKSGYVPEVFDSMPGGSGPSPIEVEPKGLTNVGSMVMTRPEI
jgi:hypothetical protein